MSETPAAGRFPPSEMIVSLLDSNPRYNLAESTTADLLVRELVDLAGAEAFGATALGYGSSAGAEALRDEVARVHGISREQVLMIPGSAFGLFLIAFEACRAGDNAVLAVPCFPPARDSLRALGLEIREVACQFDEGFRIDPQRVADAVDERTTLVSIASPQNPAGISTPSAVIAEMLSALEARAPAAYLLVDETYREATYGSAEPQASVASLSPRVITVASLSKAHGAPGLRTGWLTTTDPALLARLAAARLNTVISSSPVTEALALALLRNREPLLRPRRASLARALATLAKWQNGEAARLAWVRPDAGALCCFRLRASVFADPSVQEFWRLLPEHGVQLAKGVWFGAPERVFRLGFGYLPHAEFGKGLEAVSAAMDAVTT